MKSSDAALTVPPLIVKHIAIFICPICGGPLKVSDSSLRIKCSQCGRSFGCGDGIPLLFWPNEWEDSKADVTDVIKSFYEEHPFPNYEDLDSVWSLKEKAEKGIFARLLDKQISYDARILEVGCGTGQLSNFLGMTWGRAVFAADICLNSLKLGDKFKRRSEIETVAFLQMNLFNPVFKPESFDLVICSGVLHHTSDPFLGFQSVSSLVKKGGFIVVGLYNAYGRIPTKIRSLIFRLSGGRFKFLDPRVRNKKLGDTRRHTWFLDQYENPHESTHTAGEVLSWFERTGFEFVNSIPKLAAFEPFSEKEELFKTGSAGTKLDRVLVQLGMLLGGGREGGLFVMIGRKN